jgi:hypothetical protein
MSEVVQTGENHDVVLPQEMATVRALARTISQFGLLLIVVGILRLAPVVLLARAAGYRAPYRAAFGL